MSTIRTQYVRSHHACEHADFDELAGIVRANGDSRIGVMFARKLHDARHALSEKDKARDKVMRHYLDDRWPVPLKLLTMPGLKWRLEGMLFGARNNGMWMGLDTTTTVLAVESDRAIFAGSLRWMPERATLGISTNSSTVVTTPSIRYELAEVEDVIVRPNLDLDAAWIDFNGFLTLHRVDALYRLWTGGLRDSLTVTSLAARHDPLTTEVIRRHGGIGRWLNSVLPESRIVYDHSYSERVPMHQVMLRRIGVHEYYRQRPLDLPLP